MTFFLNYFLFVFLFLQTIRVDACNNFFQAIYDNNDEFVLETIRESPCLLSAIDENGNTPLMIALSHGNVSLVMKLVDDPHIDLIINDTNNDGDTPLILAVRQGFAAIVALLITGLKCSLENSDFLASINYQNNNGESALFVAALNKNDFIVDYLLCNGADFNIGNNQGTSVLMAAVSSSNSYAVERLLKLKASLRIVNNNGDTVFTYAVKNGNCQILELLLQSDLCFINVANAAGHSPLFIAVSENKSEVVNLLCIYGAKKNVYYACENGATVLIIAAKRNYYDTVATLVNFLPRHYLVDNQKRSAFDYARENNSSKIVRLLESLYRKK